MIANASPDIADHQDVLPPTALDASVVIVNYNGGDALLRCLRSLAETATPRSEIVLVDNASSDGSAARAEVAFPGVRVIHSETNQGFGHGCNAGASLATGNYLAFLNPDTVVTPGWLEALVAALESDPGAGLATSRILLLDEPEKVNTCGNDVHFTGIALCRGMGTDRREWDQPSEVTAVSGAAFAIRRDLFQQLGGFDEQFFLYMEDTDLSWRARLAGYRCVYVPSSVVYHQYTLRFGPRKTFYQERNRYLLLLKGLSWPTLLALLPSLLVAELVTWGYVLLREPRRFTNKLRAYLWVVGHWGRVMAARRRVQAHRRVRDRYLLARSTHRLDFEQTGKGVIPSLAKALFDTLFLALQRLTLALMWW